MRSIPIANDVAELVGDLAEGVKNRSLLVDKFVLPKFWIDDKPDRKNDASRWSLLRICEGGSAILMKEANDAKYKATKGLDSRGGAQAAAAAEILPLLANTNAEAEDAQRLRSQHSQRLHQLAKTSLAKNACVFNARLMARMAINLSDGLIENGGIALDRLFGLPFIPGSALKGVARHAALAEIKAAPEESQLDLLDRFIRVFGTSVSDFKNKGALASYSSTLEPRDKKGGVTFLPSNPVDDVRLEVDLTNVHTPEYYTGRGNVRAGSPEGLKNEKPLPNYFPTVAAGAAFGFIIALNSIGKKGAESATTLSDARRWLEAALTVGGIGAKTGAGYGWFALDKELDEKLEREALEARKAAEAKRAKEEEAATKAREEEERRAKLDPLELEIEELLSLDEQGFAEAAKNLTHFSELRQEALLKLLLGEKRAKWKSWKRRKPAIADSIRKSAENLNVELP